MSPIAFDTLKLAQRLEAAGLPSRQAQEIVSALGETIGDAIVTREYLDLRLEELRTKLGLRLGELRAELDLRLAELRTELNEVRATTATMIAEAKSEVLKWMFGAVGVQTLAILGGMATLLRLLH
jgi:hypothetical protein